MRVNKLFILFLPIILFIADRIIKYLAPSISVEGDFLSLGFYKNYAGAFSLPIAGWLYNIAGIILLAAFVYLFFKEIKIPLNPPFSKGEVCSSLYKREEGRDFKKLLAYSFILLGGLSNMADRLVLGYTIDYVNFFDFSFFNIADGMLIIGIAILLYCHIVKDKKRTNNVAM